MTKKRILIIDDETFIRLNISGALKSEGFEVLEAEGGIEGLKLFKSQKVDVVVTDIIMKGGEGIETLRWIKEADHDIPVIGISANSDYLNSLKKLGAAATLMKPFKVEELIEIIREVMISAE